MCEGNFERFERKFVITQEQLDKLFPLLEERLIRDKFSLGDGYSIYNLYLDNKVNTSIRNSLRKPYFKEKIRLRSYTLDNNNKIFFEIKRKVGKIVTKRRIKVYMNEALDLIERGILPSGLSEHDLQVAKEIKHIVSTNNMEPKVFLSYDRIAYYDPKDSNFRLTIDKNIKYRYDNVSFTGDSSGIDVLSPNTYVLEVKFLHGLPLWIVSIFSDLQIYQSSYSKYGHAYENHLRSGINVY